MDPEGAQTQVPAVQGEAEGDLEGDLGGVGTEGAGMGHVMASDSHSMTHTWYTILGQVSTCSPLCCSSCSESTVTGSALRAPLLLFLCASARQLSSSIERPRGPGTSLQT